MSSKTNKQDAKLLKVIEARSGVKGIDATVTRVTDDEFFFTIDGSPADVVVATAAMTSVPGISMDTSPNADSFAVVEDDPDWTCAFLVLNVKTGAAFVAAA